MRPPFGAFKVRIDPWEVDYGDQTPLAAPEEIQLESVSHTIEVEPA